MVSHSSTIISFDWDPDAVVTVVTSIPTRPGVQANDAAVDAPR